MEEVDHIILLSLKQLGLPFPEDIDTLDEFPDELVLQSAKRCIDVITEDNEEYDEPKVMSQKVLLATKLADTCKKLGYKGDLGYQLFLYPNENDVRKIFMFLIEKLPKESEKNYLTAPRDGLSLLMQNIGLKIAEELNDPWTPPYCKQKALKLTSNCEWSLSDCSYVDPFNRVPLEISPQDENVVQVVIDYWNKVLPGNLKSASENTDSIVQANVLINKLKDHRPKSSLKGDIRQIQDNLPYPGDTNLFKDSFDTAAVLSIESVTSAMNDIEEKTKSIQNEIDSLKENKKTMLSDKESEISKKKAIADKKDTVSLVASLLPDTDHNMAKLQTIYDKEAAKIANLKKEIEENEVREKELIQEREVEKIQKIEQSKKTKVIKSLEEKIKGMSDEREKKTSLKLHLTREIEKKNAKKKFVKKRSAYTKRIMEIIGNISKQKVEINKILSDTRVLQKELNTMNGKLDRSFAVVDELVFKDAKKDEHARKAYKLLAYIHTNCGDIVNMVNDIGSHLREIRDLEKNVETERKKKIKENMERVYLDLKYEQSNKQKQEKES